MFDSISERVIELLIAQALVRPLLLGLDGLARGIVGADQQVADDRLIGVAQGGHRDDGGQSAAVLADIGQFIDIFDATRRLENQGFEPRSDGGFQFGTEPSWRA